MLGSLVPEAAPARRLPCLLRPRTSVCYGPPPFSLARADCGESLSKEQDLTMKPNVIVALLVGLVLGFAFGQAFKGSGGPANLAGRLTMPAAAPAMTDESSLAIKSADMPAATFTGMTDVQKVAVMRVLNEHDCDCGSGRG